MVQAYPAPALPATANPSPARPQLIIETQSQLVYSFAMVAEAPEICRPARSDARRPVFTESPAWQQVAGGWQPLHGDFRRLGYSVEWHDFSVERDLDWSRSFHPESVEICLNLSGRAEVKAAGQSAVFGECSGGFYGQKQASLFARRKAGERHQFVTIELSLPFLKRHILSTELNSAPAVAKLLGRTAECAVSPVARLTAEQQQFALGLRHPPAAAAGRRLWYQAKALEAAAFLLYQAAPEEELFCERRKRVNRERVQKVVAILKENLSEPPALEELARRVGCSQYYLSRLFTVEMGKTISASLRDLRMERAAILLRSGRWNVTEVALEVGYSSLSHFSATFHETFGCCPGLYGV